MRDMLELQIAASVIRGKVPSDLSLEDRIKFSMRYVREHERDIFWMSSSTDDDMKFKTAIAAVMIEGSELDKDIIERSMRPLKMLSAAIQGVPVDFSTMPSLEGLLPLMKLWHETA